MRTRFMTLDDVRDRLDDIRSTRNSDPEHAHGAREGLYLKVLRHIARDERGTETGRLAAEALKAERIKMRW